MEGAKIRVKVGSMEIEYEGDPAFLKDGLEGLLSKVADISASVEVVADPGEANDKENSVPGGEANGAKLPSFSTGTVAAALSAKSCSDLALAALSKIQIVDGSEGATRAEILEEMKTASGYYKKSFGSGNLSKALGTLTKSGRLHEVSGSRFALSAGEKEKIKSAIANH